MGRWRQCNYSPAKDAGGASVMVFVLKICSSRAIFARPAFWEKDMRVRVSPARFWPACVGRATRVD
eukprot:15483642-Alexandrium_andersonii.AAC.1